jgi:hypothetical protein
VMTNGRFAGSLRCVRMYLHAREPLCGTRRSARGMRHSARARAPGLSGAAAAGCAPHARPPSVASCRACKCNRPLQGATGQLQGAICPLQGAFNVARSDLSVARSVKCCNERFVRCKERFVRCKERFVCCKERSAVTRRGCSAASAKASRCTARPRPFRPHASLARAAGGRGVREYSARAEEGYESTHRGRREEVGTSHLQSTSCAGGISFAHSAPRARASASPSAIADAETEKTSPAATAAATRSASEQQLHAPAPPLFRP